MAGPRKPSGSDWDPTLDDAEIFVETPTARSDIGPLPESDDASEVVGFDDMNDDDTLPGVTGEIPMIAEPLPEMDAEIWQAGIQAVVTVSDDAPPVWPTAEEWAAEARRYRTESALADGPVESARLLVAAARAFEQAGDAAQAARVCDEALSHDANAPEALRARARLAEGRGEFDDAHALWARMATAMQAADDRGFYGALSAEWTLARGGKLPPIARQAIPAGPARALAQAEEALRAGATGDLAAALAEAGRGTGGALGAALLEHAARCREVARDRPGAAAERAEAAKLDPYAPTSMAARLRDAARADDRAALPLLDEISSGPEGVLSMALARWSAALASRSGDKKRAAVLREGLAPVTAAAARDRIDQEAAAGAPLDAASLERLRAGITGAAGVAVLSWIEAGNLARRGEIAGALALMGRAIAESADAIPLGLLAQQIAADSTDAGVRATAFDLWLRSDPGRRAEAALALAEARQAASGGEDPLAARGALQTAIEAAPGSALFWSVAAADARAGRQADAAATLSYGADMWGPSALAPGLRACALSHLSLGDPGHAFEDLRARLAESPAPPPTRSFELEARARLAERAGDAGALASMLAAAAGAADPDRAASLAPRRADLVDAAVDRQGRARIFGEALEGVPDHPSALALLLLEDGVTPAAAGEALWRAGAAAADASAGPIARWYRLAAGASAALDADADAAVARASELVAVMPSDRLAKRALLRVRRARGARPARTHDRRAHRGRAARRRRPGRGRGGAGGGAGAGRGGRSARGGGVSRARGRPLRRRRAAGAGASRRAGGGPGGGAGASAGTAGGARRRDRRRRAHRADGSLRCGARRKLGRRDRVAARRSATRGRRRIGDAARGGAAGGRARKAGGRGRAGSRRARGGGRRSRRGRRVGAGPHRRRRRQGGASRGRARARGDAICARPGEGRGGGRRIAAGPSGR